MTAPHDPARRTVLLADDEPLARRRLRALLARHPQYDVVAECEDGVEAVEQILALRPDLVFLDIHMPELDGVAVAEALAAEAERGGQVPVLVFVTAYDAHAVRAFDLNAVDYLLKPVDEARLAAAFAKHAQLRRHFAGEIAGLIDALQAPRPRLRQRILGRQGAQHHAIGIDRVAYFVSVDKITHAVALDGTRYVLDMPLAELEPELDPARFFRANRQLLVSASSVSAFRAAGKGRLVLTLQPPAAGEVAVSQERAALFREWLAQ